MIAGSLFSGVGGLDLGLTRAGYEHAFFSEVDPWRRDVLRAHYPGTTIYDDVRDVGHRQWSGQERSERLAEHHAPIDRLRGTESARLRDEPCHLLAGGFPCQDLSVAGRRAGLAGDRSGLFFEFARIADALRPRWVLLENVPGLLSSNDGRDMGVVIGTLADLGYGVAWRILDARYFGVPQRRRRVFIVCRAGGDDASALRALCESCNGNLATSQCTWQGAASEPGERPAFALRRNPGGVGQGHNTNYIVNALDRQRGGPDDNSAQAGHLVVANTLMRHHTRLDPEFDTFVTAFAENSRAELVEASVHQSLTKPGGKPGQNMAVTRIGSSVRRLTPIECERLMSWPDGWTAPEGVKAPDSRRYAACGDGVVSNVSEWIGRRIRAIDEAA